jgi:hypothetical protein
MERSVSEVNSNKHSEWMIEVVLHTWQKLLGQLELYTL